MVANGVTDLRDLLLGECEFGQHVPGEGGAGGGMLFFFATHIVQQPGRLDDEKLARGRC